MKTIVVYKSRYGETARYAQWIADRLNCPCKPTRKAGSLKDYDVVVFGSPVYRGRPLARHWLQRHVKPTQKVFIFMVGLTDPRDGEAYADVARHYGKRLLSQARFFSMRGGLRMKRLKVMDRGTISGLSRMIERRGRIESSNEAVILKAMDQDVVYTDIAHTRDLVDAIRHQR